MRWYILIGLSLSQSLVGCSDGQESAQRDAATSQDLRALTENERAALNETSGVTVVGALPTITTTRASNSDEKQLQDVSVGGPYGSGPYYFWSHYFTGFAGRAGAFIDAIQFKSGMSGSVLSAVYGGNGGSPFAVDCPDSGTDYPSVIAGIQGRAGVYVDKLGPVCASLYDSNDQVIRWGGVGGVTSARSGPVGRGFTLRDGPLVGGSGGDGFYYVCPMPYWIVGFSVSSGQYVDRITAYCGYS